MWRLYDATPCGYSSFSMKHSMGPLTLDLSLAYNYLCKTPYNIIDVVIVYKRVEAGESYKLRSLPAQNLNSFFFVSFSQRRREDLQEQWGKPPPRPRPSIGRRSRRFTLGISTQMSRSCNSNTFSPPVAPFPPSVSAVIESPETPLNTPT